MVQGGEGGGHTGSVPTTLLLPTVLDAVGHPRRRGRWLLRRTRPRRGAVVRRGRASAWARASCSPRTPRCPTRSSSSTWPPTSRHRGDRQGRRDAAPDAAHDLVEEVEETAGCKRLGPDRYAGRSEFKRDSGMSWGRSRRRPGDEEGAAGARWSQMTLAANTPTMLKAGLVEGDTGAGVLASRPGGRACIDDLPTCEELIDRIVTRRSTSCGALPLTRSDRRTSAGRRQPAREPPARRSDRRAGARSSARCWRCRARPAAGSSGSRP